MTHKELENFIKDEYIVRSANSKMNFDLLKDNFRKSKEEYTIERLKKIKNDLANNNVETLSMASKDYYEKLKNIYYAPYNIFYKGKMIDLNSKTVAIVGSRKATKEGLQIAYDIAYKLAKRGIIIVSGMANGIDTFAHSGALAADGKTIAVLGNGLDICYPQSNMKLMQQIAKRGMLISEYTLGTKPLKTNFPKRNRIISALADFVLVVEAEEKSGSLITAAYALEQGKDIGAVPGSVNNDFSKGTNGLIKEGAYLIRNAEDILDIIF